MLVNVPRASFRDYTAACLSSACRHGNATGRGGFGSKPLDGVISVQSLTLCHGRGRWRGGLEEVISRGPFQPQASVIL